MGDFFSVQNMHRFRTCLAMVEMISHEKQRFFCSEFGRDFWLRSCGHLLIYWTVILKRFLLHLRKFKRGLGKNVSPASNMASQCLGPPCIRFSGKCTGWTPNFMFSLPWQDGILKLLYMKGRMLPLSQQEWWAEGLYFKAPRFLKTWILPLASQAWGMNLTVRPWNVTIPKGKGSSSNYHFFSGVYC